GNSVTGKTMTIEAIPVSNKPPLYAESENDDHHSNAWEVGLLLRNESTRRSLAYFPTLTTLSPTIEKYLREADILMIDGTFWSQNELVGMGAAGRDAHDMGHLPVGGAEGTAEKLAAFRHK